MKRFALLVMAACGRLNGDDQSGSDGGGGDPAVCEANFEKVVNRKCSTVSDCDLISHPDCCGPVLIGVAGSGSDGDLMAESDYERCETSACGPVGCSHPEESEDHMVPGPNQMIAAQCVDNQCSSTVITFMP